MKKVYEFISDAGHGWMKVPAKELKQLGIVSEITYYSYLSTNRKFVYLEEDYDAGIFIKAKRAIGQEVKFRERNVNYARLRNFYHYKPEYADFN